MAPGSKGDGSTDASPDEIALLKAKGGKGKGKKGDSGKGKGKKGDSGKGKGKKGDTPKGGKKGKQQPERPNAEKGGGKKGKKGQTKGKSCGKLQATGKGKGDEKSEGDGDRTGKGGVKKTTPVKTPVETDTGSPGKAGGSVKGKTGDGEKGKTKKGFGKKGDGKATKGGKKGKTESSGKGSGVNSDQPTKSVSRESLDSTKRSRPDDAEESSQHTPPAKKHRGSPGSTASDGSTPTPKPAATSLTRQLSSVSVSGILDDKNPRVKRDKVLSEDQRNAINQMQRANEIPHSERKRQWNALHRRLQQPDLPEGLLEKWAASKTAASKFEFLKCFLMDPSMQSMHIECFHKEQSKKRAKATYVELPLDQLELKYDPKWLAEKVVSCQKGRSHPQDPDNPKKRIYKVFDKIEDVRIDEESTGHQVLGSAKVAPNKAVRASLESGLTAKAASSSGGDMDLWGGLGFMEKPKKLPNTKPKKEKTPEELEKKQFDTDLAKIQSLAIKARTTASKLNDAGIAHQEAMIANLKNTFKEVSGIYNKINDMVFQQKATSECREALAEFETNLEVAEKAIKDAESIVSGHERRVAAEKRKAEGPPKAKSKAKAAKAKSKAEGDKNKANVAALARMKSEAYENTNENDEYDEYDDDLEEEMDEEEGVEDPEEPHAETAET